MNRIAAILVTLSSCIPAPPAAVDGFVSARVSKPQQLAVAAPLRYAVVWTVENGLVVTTTGEVAGDLSRGVSINIPLNLPDRAILAAATPVEMLRITTSSPLVDIYRPRLVVFADVDGDGRFAPSLLGTGGPDAVLAVDNGEVAALRDPEAALSELTLDDQARYYENTQGVFGAFVRVHRELSALTLDSQPAVVELAVVDPVLAQASLECERAVDPSLRLTDSLKRTAFVDTGLDALSTCGLWIDDCNSVVLEGIVAPSSQQTEAGSAIRLVQCRQSSLTEAFYVLRLDTVCQECVCNTMSDIDIYLIDPKMRPSWWPCGSTIDYCGSTLPPFFFEYNCEES